MIKGINSHKWALFVLTTFTLVNIYKGTTCNQRCPRLPADTCNYILKTDRNVKLYMSIEILHVVSRESANDKILQIEEPRHKYIDISICRGHWVI